MDISASGPPLHLRLRFLMRFLYRLHTITKFMSNSQTCKGVFQNKNPDLAKPKGNNPENGRFFSSRQKSHTRFGGGEWFFFFLAFSSRGLPPVGFWWKGGFCFTFRSWWWGWRHCYPKPVYGGKILLAPLLSSVSY